MNFLDLFKQVILLTYDPEGSMWVKVTTSMGGWVGEFVKAFTAGSFGLLQLSIRQIGQVRGDKQRPLVEEKRMGK